MRQELPQPMWSPDGGGTGISPIFLPHTFDGRRKEDIVSRLQRIEFPLHHKFGIVLGEYTLLDGSFGLGYAHLIDREGNYYDQLALYWTRDRELVVAGQNSSGESRVQVFTPDTRTEPLVLKFPQRCARDIYLGDDMHIKTKELRSDSGRGRLIVDANAFTVPSVASELFGISQNPKVAFKSLRERS